MKHSRLFPLFLLTLLTIVVLGFVFDNVGQAAKPTAQEPEKSLDIERYAIEPFELVELKIGDQLVKDKITIKVRRNDEGLDNVSFRDNDGWFKHISVKLRNVSGRPIVGLRAYLHLKPPGSQILYRVQLAPTKDLSKEPLQPDAEIGLRVTDQMWDPIAALLQQRSLNPDLADITLSVDTAMFSDQLQWYRGNTLHRDADNPNRWKPVKFSDASQNSTHPQ